MYLKSKNFDVETTVRRNLDAKNAVNGGQGCSSG